MQVSTWEVIYIFAELNDYIDKPVLSLWADLYHSINVKSHSM